jgi:hypothetical protein
VRFFTTQSAYARYIVLLIISESSLFFSSYVPFTQAVHSSSTMMKIQSGQEIVSSLYVNIYHVLHFWKRDQSKSQRESSTESNIECRIVLTENRESSAESRKQRAES